MGGINDGEKKQCEADPFGYFGYGPLWLCRLRIGDDPIFGQGKNDWLYGGAGDDTLTGKGGNDYLDDGAGADIMAGGADDDTYIVDDAGDVVIESANEGTDTVYSSVSIALPDHVENLNLTGAGDVDAIGNAEANNITGNTGANRLEGGAGNDQLWVGIHLIGRAANAESFCATASEVFLRKAA